MMFLFMMKLKNALSFTIRQLFNYNYVPMQIYCCPHYPNPLPVHYMYCNYCSEFL